MTKIFRIMKQLTIIAFFTFCGLLLSAIHFSIGHFFLPIIAPYFLFWTAMGIITGVIASNIKVKNKS